MREVGWSGWKEPALAGHWGCGLCWPRSCLLTLPGFHAVECCWAWTPGVSQRPWLWGDCGSLLLAPDGGSEGQPYRSMVSRRISQALILVSLVLSFSGTVPVWTLCASEGSQGALEKMSRISLVYNFICGGVLPVFVGVVGPTLLGPNRLSQSARDCTRLGQLLRPLQTAVAATRWARFPPPSGIWAEAVPGCCTQHPARYRARPSPSPVHPSCSFPSPPPPAVCPHPCSQTLLNSDLFAHLL